MIDILMMIVLAMLVVNGLVLCCHPAFWNSPKGVDRYRMPRRKVPELSVSKMKMHKAMMDAEIDRRRSGSESVITIKQSKG